MNIDWAMLFDFLADLIGGCDGDEVAKIQAVRSPLRLRAAVTRGLRRQGFRGQELRAAREIAVQRIDMATEDEIVSFLRAE